MSPVFLAAPGALVSSKPERSFLNFWGSRPQEGKMAFLPSAFWQSKVSITVGPVHTGGFQQGIRKYGEKKAPSLHEGPEVLHYTKKVG